jgi:hypothetical protein
MRSEQEKNTANYKLFNFSRSEFGAHRLLTLTLLSVNTLAQKEIPLLHSTRHPFISLSLWSSPSLTPCVLQPTKIKEGMRTEQFAAHCLL